MDMCLICLNDTTESFQPVEDNPHLITCKPCADKITKSLSEPRISGDRLKDTI